MKISKKTTAFGVIGGLSLILTQIWFAVDGVDSTTFDYARLIEGLGLLGIGWFARDNDVTSKQAGAE